MRNQHLKLTKQNSTKGERRIAEILKRNHIKFRAKCRVAGREIDFLIGRTAIEVDGSIHKGTDTSKDTVLFAHGYVPIHVNPRVEVGEKLEQQILTLIRNNN